MRTINNDFSYYSSQGDVLKFLQLSFILLLFAFTYAALPGFSTVPLTDLTVTPSQNTTDNLDVNNFQLNPINPIVSDLILQSGPYVYVAATPALVIDSSTRKVVSKIKSEEKDSYIDAIAVSPDGQFVYVSISWAVYESDSYGGHYNKFTRIVRLNATTQDPIDYFSFDGIYSEHLDVSPDGKVYLGFEDYYYPHDAGVKIMDFSQGKSWYLDAGQNLFFQSFEFSPDGSKVYYGAWWQTSRVYELDWTENKVHVYWLPGNQSDYHQYTRSLALGIDGKMLYAVVNTNSGIFAMNTQDKGKHVISTTYIPVTLAISPDEQTLYTIGYFLDSGNKPIYVIHKYGGLKVIGPYDGAIEDYSLSEGSTFYTTDAMNYITKPNGAYPSKMTISGDGKFGFISTAKNDGVSDPHGSDVLVYDLEYLNQLPNIPAINSGPDISAASEKIVYSPTPDYSWLDQFAINLPKFDSTVIFVKKFYPENGTFADQYKEEFFEPYAIFTEALDNKTVNSTTLWLSEKSGTLVSGHTTAASNIAIFVPDEQLKTDTDYVVHLSKNIKSKTGKPLYADIEWSFNTKNVSFYSPLSNTSINFSLVKQISPISVGKFVTPSINDSQPTNQSGPEITPPQINVSIPSIIDIPGSVVPTLPNDTLVPDSNTSKPDEANTSQEQSNDLGSPGSEITINPQPEPPGDDTSNQLNPQPEPPAPKGIVDIIIDFFKGIFGW
ncbi:Bacterial Ig-like domain protein [Candidatus Bilamarchaeum dharawalense]|uniref:Bacterial Ig-like domain protein n=1 Tax=Candidatus Bilamarchaeum dharawalense TaxID=2885759 RepID=A0A5E4LTH9_9ARCH|nr:Bacterial Ig-like domain protein [Candidatus Bilamarchaeum dharawalense]